MDTDSVTPSIKSITVDSGNSYSPSSAIDGNTITLRVVVESPEIKLSLKQFGVGNKIVSPNATFESESSNVWVARYKVSAGDSGWFTFVIDARNDLVGNVVRLTDASGVVDKKVLVG